MDYFSLIMALYLIVFAALHSLLASLRAKTMARVLKLPVAIAVSTMFFPAGDILGVAIELDSPSRLRPTM